MFGGYGGPHCDGTEDVTKTTDPKEVKETEANSQQGIEDRLNANPIYDENKEADTEEEGENLQPDEGATRTTGSCGFGLIDEIFQLVVLPIVGPFFSGVDQGDVLAPVTAIF